MLYDICGLKVSYEAKYQQTIIRSEKYISCDQNQTPDIVIDITEERIDNYISVYPNISRSLAEYVIIGAVFYEKILDFNAFLLHSSAIEVDGKAYLFTADSGTGKSTHTSLWREYFGDRATMINDDKPVIRMIDNKLYACGTPFSGKHDINKNILIPIQGICYLNRGLENKIEKMNSRDALIVIMNQTLRVDDKLKMLNLFDMLDEVLCNVNVYKLYCNISKEAVETAYNGMKGDSN
ncbi:MAG: hypothetical protein J1F17_05245 [Oscillospiraceae bacterium]|nr:hypothetical protein [Oscillospiraceae bacterium]